MENQETTNILDTLSPLDGRYRQDTATLRDFFSEAALYRYRVKVEVEYLIFLARVPTVSFVQNFSPQQQAKLRTLYSQFSPQDAEAISAWDRRVNHDVKAVEYWLREQLTQQGLEASHEAVHFALTSEDTNNLAYSLLIRDARDQVLIPALNELLTRLRELAHQEATTAMLARTHGQPATPTTMGKEIAVFAHRLNRAIETLSNTPMTGKLNGATGTLAAHYVAYPEVDWLKFSRAFIRTLNLEPMTLTTQIEPHDMIATLCDAIKRTNTILLDLSQDMWRYISDNYLIQAPKSQEIGSSTMPHKVNPIDFENAEGNLGLANALLEFFSRKLPISRLQRDLSDSTVLRNLGVACGYSIVAYQRILKGLNKLAVNHARLTEELHNHPEVLAEAIQTILRRCNYPQPYEALKEFSRGKKLTVEDIQTFIETLDVDAEVKTELHALAPETYTGIADQIVQSEMGT